MTDTRYKITMDGSIAPGVTLDFAQDNFARLFKTDVSAVKRLFSGGPTVIKRDVTEADADKYVQALFNAGVIARKEVDLAANLSLETIESDADTESTERMTCPKCDTEQARKDMCANCGIVIAKFNNYQAQAKQAISTAAASPYASPMAIIDNDSDEVGELKIWGVDGRIGRMRSIAWGMVFMFALLPALLVCAVAFKISEVLGGLIFVGVFIAAIVIYIQINVKRLHDIGWSGWLLLIILVPLVGSIFQLLISVMPGSKGNNLYGAPPPENSTAVKVLFGIWVAFLVIIFIAVMTTGILGTMLSMQDM